MTNTMKFLGIGIAVAAAVVASDVRRVDAECATCTVQQECEPGENGAHCIIFYEDGRQWCNWQGFCEPQQTMLTPDLLTPSGSFFAVEGVEDVDRGISVATCPDFVVDHLVAPDDHLSTISI